MALALWLAANRRRMLIYLGIGVIVAFLLARLAMSAAENVDRRRDRRRRRRGSRPVDRRRARSRTCAASRSSSSSRPWSLVIAAYLWGRPKWVVATTAYVSDTAGRAGSAAGAAASGGAASVAGRAPDRATVEDTVRDNRSAVEKFGIGIIVFVLVWIAIGLEVALLGAALVIGFLLLLRAIDGDPTTTRLRSGRRRDHHRGASRHRDRDPGGLPAPVEAAPLTPAPRPQRTHRKGGHRQRPNPSSATQQAARADGHRRQPHGHRPSHRRSQADSHRQAAAAAKPPAKTPAKPKQPPKPKPPTG